MKKIIIILITILLTLSIIYLYYLKIEENKKVSDDITQDISLNKNIGGGIGVESSQLKKDYGED
ncbi:hypothetical protein HUU51_03630 [Candidatus Gracilibacteria bacterium]|nr:hypothetical protein [Candidatus Gracilibacteria bacterium]